jgi:heme exporter protein D
LDPSNAADVEKAKALSRMLKKEAQQKLSCRYFRSGSCKNGSECPFKHESSSAPKTAPVKSSSSAPKGAAKKEGSKAITEAAQNLNNARQELKAVIKANNAERDHPAILQALAAKKNAEAALRQAKSESSSSSSAAAASSASTKRRPASFKKIDASSSEGLTAAFQNLTKAKADLKEAIKTHNAVRDHPEILKAVQAKQAAAAAFKKAKDSESAKPVQSKELSAASEALNAAKVALKSVIAANNSVRDHPEILKALAVKRSAEKSFRQLKRKETGKKSKTVRPAKKEFVNGKETQP